MDTSTLLTVPPTFPVADERIRVRRLARMAMAPVTWGTGLVVLVAGLLLDLGAAGFVTMGIVAGVALTKYWKRRCAAVDAVCLRELIEESNVLHNLALEQIIASLEGCGQGQYAVCLRRFLALKKAVETEIYREGHLALFAREVEEGIDGISKEVCLEITRLRESEGELAEVLTSRDPERLARMEAARHGSQAAILQAYATLHQTYASMVALNATGSNRGKASSRSEVAEDEGLRSAPGKRLTEILDHLRGQAEVIARTQARVESSLAGGRMEEAN